MFFENDKMTKIEIWNHFLKNPQSAIRNPQSTIRNPQSDIPNPTSPIPNPQSDIRNPTSAILQTKVSRIFCIFAINLFNQIPEKWA
jgi:hypothetical protein